MTTFTDGPAWNQRLMLKRTPVFLRVTEAAGKWDALDQLDDEPRPDETLHVYLLVQVAGFACVRTTRGKGGIGGGGCYPIASYKLFRPQPSDATLRDRASWVAWVEQQAKWLQGA